MSSSASKIDLLFKICDLQEQGRSSDALKLQKIFLEAIRQEKQAGSYSQDINLDRQSKKIATTSGLTLFSSTNK